MVVVTHSVREHVASLQKNSSIRDQILEGKMDDSEEVQSYAAFRETVVKETIQKMQDIPPSDEQYGGLARAIVFAFELYAPTPNGLLTHLKLSGIDAPQWLLDEPEMRRRGHAISKGTRAVIIYKAMLHDLDERIIIRNTTHGLRIRNGYDFIDLDRAELVQRRTGSWYGVVCGSYKTPLTPRGFNVMSLMEYGAVHVEPASNLKPWDGVFEGPDPRAVELVDKIKSMR